MKKKATINILYKSFWEEKKRWNGPVLKSWSITKFLPTVIMEYKGL